MWEWIRAVIADANILTVIFTLATVVLASIKNWLIAEQKLKLTYIFMILLGLAYVGLNTNIALSNKSQMIIMVMNLPALWTSLMGVRGLLKLKKDGTSE